VSDQPITEPESDQPEPVEAETGQPETGAPETGAAETGAAESDEPESDEPETGDSNAAQSNAGAESAKQGAAPTATAVLTHVVRSIVDDADAVHVDAIESRNRLKLEVKVGPGDLGRVIGRRGRTAQSIRTVVRAAATRDGVEVDVDFVD
jgi:predicted RNA-binding protein YlqC (UPF0109 family)